MRKIGRKSPINSATNLGNGGIRGGKGRSGKLGNGNGGKSGKVGNSKFGNSGTSNPGISIRTLGNNSGKIISGKFGNEIGSGLNVTSGHKIRTPVFTFDKSTTISGHFGNGITGGSGITAKKFSNKLNLLKRSFIQRSQVC